MNPLHHRPYVRRRDREASDILAVVALVLFIGMIAVVFA